MPTVGGARPEDIWPAGCPHAPAVRDEILRVAQDEVTYADVERSGLRFAPWYSKAFLAEQRVLAGTKQPERQETEVERLRRRVEELEGRLQFNVDRVNQALACISGELDAKDELLEVLADRIAAMAAPNLGFDDLTVLHDGERGVLFRVTRGDQFKDFPIDLPIPIDRGTWQAGQTYARGDLVTFGGQIWIAQTDTAERPGGNERWRLAVRRGRDLKSKRGEDERPGPAG